MGEALVHLNSEDLKEMGITSVGHTLSILKAVYNVKVAHEIPIEAEHYVPICMSILGLTIRYREDE